MDLAMVYELTTRIITKRVVLPNLDGLYGGKPCKMMDGQETTKYKQGEGDDEYDYSGEQEEEEDRRRRRKRSTEDDDDYKDGEEEGGKYYGTDDQEIQLKACDLPICLAQPPEDDAGEFKGFPPDINPPCIAVWTEWGKWGSCDMSCGAEGKRKRKRECVKHCSPEEDKKIATGCREGSTQLNVNVTDTDTTSCRLCPPDKSGTWSTWSEFEAEEGFTCSDDEDAVTKYTRKRKCIPGAKDKKCLPGASDKTSGYDEQSMKQPRPPCDGQDPNAWKQTKEERKENEKMLKEIAQESAKESGETLSPDPEEDPKEEDANEEEEDIEEY